MSLVVAVLVVLIIVAVGYYVWNVQIKQSPFKPKGPCTSAADCPSGTVCVDGVCAGGGCGPGNLCPKGQKCQSGACIGGRCIKNTDCPEDQTCSSGVCAGGCRNVLECPSGDKCINGTCIAQSCNWTDKKCPLGQHCYAGLCRAGGCQNDKECPEGQNCANGACVGGGCHSNGECPPGQICKNKTCVGGCQTAADDCSSGQKCFNGKCRPVTACASTADCSFGAVCHKKACLPAPKCPPTQTIIPNTSLWMQNKKLGPTLAVSTSFSKTPLMYRPNDFAKELFYVRAVPTGTANEYYLYMPIMEKLELYQYLTRDPVNKALRFTLYCRNSSMSCTNKNYDPSADPNARWLFEGGILSDPEKTLVLSAAPCTTIPAPRACNDSISGLPLSQVAGPFLTTYDAYDCLDSMFTWQFATPSEINLT